MFIEDDELRELYKVASIDHLEKIEQGLLSLEKQPDDNSILDSLLRETHSLKGDSRMLGVEEAEMLVHQMEELLNEIKNNQTLISGDLCDRLYLGVDAVKKIAREAVTGEPSGISTFHIMAQLMGAEEEVEDRETGELENSEDWETGGPGDGENFATVSDFPSESNETSTVYIEDDELRELYKVASVDHLEKIEQGLLDLEKQPNDSSILDSLLRETHSLKGDSRMLGVADAETLVHQIEEILNEVKKGETIFSSDLCDRLYLGVDAVNKIAREAVTGEPSGVSAFHVIAQLMGAEEEDTEEVTDVGANGIRPNVIPEPIPETKIQPATPSVPSAEIETVRVDFPKLDSLMTQAGELLVTKLSLERRNDDLAQLLEFWENWSRDFALNKQLLKQLEPKLTEEERQNLAKCDRQERKYLEQFGGLVSTLKNLVLEDNARLDTVANKLETGIRNLRLLPLSTIFNLFPRMVRDLGKQLGKEIEFTIEGGEISVDKRILEEIKAPLTHIIRNAIDHGIETPQERVANNKPQKAKLLLKGSQNNNRIIIEVIDDGRGLDVERIGITALKRQVCTESELLKMTPQQVQSLIFAPGFSTRNEVSEISGRGVGLDVVRENVERLKGTVEIQSTWGVGCKFQLSLNTSLSTTYVLIVEINQHFYAIPIDFVEKMILVSPEQIFQVKGTPTILWEEKPLSVAWLRDLLSLEKPRENTLSQQKIPCIILSIGSEKIGVFTDKLIEQQNVILKPQSKLLRKIPNISGATILSSGEVCMVIEPREILQATSAGKGIDSLATISSKITTKPKVLLVEDSIPIRTQVRRILISAGYDVTVAVDGLEGFNTLQAQKNFDAVVSDVEMPNLSGLEMTARIRQYSEHDELPIILVTTLATEADKRRGAEAGANAYLTKGDFDQTLLLNTLRRLI
ncbi:Chemotaxis protein histidine kinase-like protein [Hyella patelloides LEGE 07179]|uniref:histidine kinase n=1 Tax=Hyella patelloides LEGE 07179 TaxID=945734 RepID=A0A563VL46_9CYAN|nr:hybrid sensor histidine kinase/response regulator [Hyella patelloides]VEP12067.1 Chemotaxis protein histidine kinase-like protein [Hyella patelloides LEGE 07179]